MNHIADIELLRAEMSPSVFESLIHDWAEAVRDAKREVATRTGSGNMHLAWEQELVGGAVGKTEWQPPKRTYRKRSA